VSDNLVRLQKYLADRGIASRRTAEKYITGGMVKVNGKRVTRLGTKVDPAKDKVEIEDRVVKDRDEMLYILLNKPAGYITTSAPDEKNKVTDLITVRERVYPLGRLDKDTTGVLLFTNDGVLAYRLLHPKFGHEKEYEVVLADFISDAAIKKLEAGVKLDGERTQPTKIKRLGRRKFSIILREGKYHQIKRICQKVGGEVIALRRTRMENIRLGNLPEGKWRFLTDEEKKGLLKKIGIS